MGSPYRFGHVSTHHLPVPPETAWTELERFDRWTRWSQPLRSLEVEGGAPLTSGTTLRAHVDPIGPFAVRVAAVATRVVPALAAELRRPTHPRRLRARLSRR